MIYWVVITVHSFGFDGGCLLDFSRDFFHFLSVNYLFFFLLFYIIPTNSVEQLLSVVLFGNSFKLYVILYTIEVWLRELQKKRQWEGMVCRNSIGLNSGFSAYFLFLIPTTKVSFTYTTCTCDSEFIIHLQWDWTLKSYLP